MIQSVRYWDVYKRQEWILLHKCKTYFKLFIYISAGCTILLFNVINFSILGYFIVLLWVYFTLPFHYELLAIPDAPLNIFFSLSNRFPASMSHVGILLLVQSLVLYFTYTVTYCQLYVIHSEILIQSDILWTRKNIIVESYWLL